jgi:hypothetical protein
MRRLPPAADASASLLHRSLDEAREDTKTLAVIQADFGSSE